MNLPKPTGSAVGTILIDNLQIWYPAQGKLKKTRCHLPESMYCYSTNNAPIIENSHPIIIFSHGLGCVANIYTSLTEELASHGFVVVGINHKFPIHAPTTKEMYQKLRAINFFGNVNVYIEKRIADITIAIDTVEKLNQDQNSIFYNHLDINRIGAFGHSFGGSTVVQITDPRIKAGADLDGEAFTTITITKPFMFIFAEKTLKKREKLASDKELEEEGLNRTEEKIIRQGFLNIKNISGPNIYKYIIEKAGHVDLTDLTLIKKGESPDFGPIEGHKSIKILRKYLLDFFDKFLMKNAN